MNRLFVRLGARAAQGAETAEADDRLWQVSDLTWALLDPTGELISQGQGDSTALARLLEHRSEDATGVVLLVPTEFAMLLELDVPGRSAGQMRRALPFVLEEFVATEIDDMHLAHSALQRGQPVRCVAVERSQIAQWTAALKPLAIAPVAMVPEAALLPMEDHTINVLFDDADVVIAGAAQAAALDADLVVMGLESAVAGLEPDAECRVRVINGVISDLDRSQVEQDCERAISWVDDDTEVPALVYLARRWLEDPTALNLLRGEFAPPRDRDPTWAKLRPVAALVGVWFVLAIVLQATTAAWADYRAGGLSDEITDLYRSYFPDERRVVDPYRQMAQHIGQTDAQGASFTALLGHLTAELGSGGTVTVRSLAFNSGRSELSAEVTIARFDALDALKVALSGRGLDVEIASAEQQEDGIHARVRLRAG